MGGKASMQEGKKEGRAGNEWIRDFKSMEGKRMTLHEKGIQLFSDVARSFELRFFLSSFRVSGSPLKDICSTFYSVWGMETPITPVAVTPAAAKTTTSAPTITGAGVGTTTTPATISATTAPTPTAAKAAFLEAGASREGGDDGGVISVRHDVFPWHPSGSNWEHVSGSFSRLKCGPLFVIGIASSPSPFSGPKIMLRKGITAKQQLGTEWIDFSLPPPPPLPGAAANNSAIVDFLAISFGPLCMFRVIV